MRMKKAEGLSLTVVVVAALALLVLIVLSVIFVGKMRSSNQKGDDCELKGGTCYSTDEGSSCSDHGQGLIQPDARCYKPVKEDGTKDVDPNRICCIKV